MPVPLILDTDIGDDVDDVFALLLCALSREVDLLGVTVVFGDVQARARLARKMLDLAGRPDVPVAVGHGPTLDGRDPTGSGGATMASAAGFPGTPGSDDWRHLGQRLDPAHAVDFLVAAVEQAPEPPVIAAVGPLTNVAAALRRRPDLARRVRSLVLMGGRVGQDAEKGEHNFNADPEATRIVLESGAPIRIGTLEVTMQARLGEAHLPRLRAATPACRAAAAQLESYLRYRGRPETSMYDPISVTLAYADRYLITRPMALRVRTAARLVVLDTPADAPPTADVSVGLDAPAFVEHLLHTIGAG